MILVEMKRMGLQYIEGRSDIAQQLRVIREHEAERELQLQVAWTLFNKSMRTPVGSNMFQPRSVIFKTDETTSYNQPAEPAISNPSHQAACGSSYQTFAAAAAHAEVGVDKDSWLLKGVGGAWSRLHKR